MFDNKMQEVNARRGDTKADAGILNDCYSKLDPSLQKQLMEFDMDDLEEDREDVLESYKPANVAKWQEGGLEVPTSIGSKGSSKGVTFKLSETSNESNDRETGNSGHLLERNPNPYARPKQNPLIMGLNPLQRR